MKRLIGCLAALVLFIIAVSGTFAEGISTTDNILLQPTSAPQKTPAAERYSAAVPTPATSSAYPVSAKTNIQKVNVRKEPKGDSKRVAQIEKAGTSVTIIGSSYDDNGTQWYLVKLKDGRTGYVRFDLLTIVNNAPTATKQPSTVNNAPRNNGGANRGSSDSDWPTAYPRLQFEDFAFEKNQILNVYSAPSKKSWRGANGKASVGMVGGVYCAGGENGWYLIIYENSKRITRVGYSCGEDIQGPVPYNSLQFPYIPATVNTDANMTDDPAHFYSTITVLQPGTTVYLLADYRRSDMTLAYIEAYVNGQQARGFIPMASLDW